VLRSKLLPGIICLSAFVGCGTTGETEIELLNSTETVINDFSVAGEMDEGVSAGFNLDGLVSDFPDGRSCYQQDFRDENGLEGIDNALAKLLPLIDLAGEGALEGLLQEAITEGRLLLIFRLEELTNGQFNISLLRGQDTPILGTDGLVLRSQTLALHEDPNLARFENVTIENNILRAGPGKLHLPVIIFNILYELDVENGYIEFELNDTGDIVSGKMGGSVTREQVMQLATTAAGRTKGLQQLLSGGIDDAADLDPDTTGECQSLSMAVTFAGVQVFTF